eukprot:CAMPEP_0171113308 /NCGR_PEP_ID=MMETSP0766_2-20121228/81892_1 /TAXON_ID=439317 /ORGANISM="Gambierdiscus australes, Strain CAWD 149" /LENGTH=293 /DNA_ID=CAMNT_0011575503 /DNA_START=69 /DNA_END=950 /DNA_ORIENTATION=-
MACRADILSCVLASCLFLAFGTHLKDVTHLHVLTGEGIAAKAAASGAGVMAADEDAKKLMVCNAYVHTHPLDVYNMRSRQRLTSRKPLAFKECETFLVGLHDGDHLAFKVEEHNVGIFKTTTLPKTSSSLLLVPHRREAGLMSTTFESHVFKELQNTQVAVVDAYGGRAKGKVKIIDNRNHGLDASAKQSQRVEDLGFNSVVALNPGEYLVELQDEQGGSVSRASLQVSQQKATFVLMRVGSDAEGRTGTNSTFSKQELILYMQPREEVRSGAVGTHSLRLMTLAACVLLLAI